MVEGLSIRIKPRGERFTVGGLVCALERALEVLGGMGRKVGARQGEWRVESLTADGELRMRVSGEAAERIGPGYLRGIRELERGAAAPAEFDEEDLARARRLVGLLEGEVESITLAAGEETVTPTQKLAANVDAILGKRYRQTYGTIDGRLEALDVHGGNVVTIYDVLTDGRTTCEFPESMYQQAIDSLRKHVVVTGEIQYDREGNSRTMRVESMRLKRGRSELPQFRAGEEIDITGGMDSAEYIRRSRDAE